MSNNLGRTELGETQNNKYITINTSDGDLDAAITSAQNVTVTNGTNVLTTAQVASGSRLNLTNAGSPPTSAFTVQVPATPRGLVLFDNQTSHTATIEIASQAKTSPTLTAGSIALFMIDGVNVEKVVDLGGGGGGSIDVQEGGSSTVGSATALNFAAADFNITDEGSNVAGIAIAGGAGGGGGGAWEFVETITISNDATVDIDDLDGPHLLIFEDLVFATDNVNFQMRVSDDNGSTFKSGSLDYSYTGASYAPNWNAFSATNDDLIELIGDTSVNIGNLAGEGMHGWMYTSKLDSTALKAAVHATLYYTNSDGVASWSIASGEYDATSAIDAVQFFADSGNISSGKIHVFKLSLTGGAANDWNLVETLTASASASIDISNLGNAGYKIELEDIVPASDDVELWLRVSDDNGATYESGASAYDYSSVASISGTSTDINSTGAAQIVLTAIAAGEAAGNAGDESLSGEIILSPLGNTARHKMARFEMAYGEAGGDIAHVKGAGRFIDSVVALDGLQLLFESGNIASGTVRVYRRG